MALFNREPENEVQPELSAKPQSPPVPAASVPQPPPSAEGKVAPLRQAAPAPLEGCAYLDQGSKVSGKLNFEGASADRCTDDTLKLAKENLAACFGLVGLTERFEETLALAKIRFGWAMG